MSDLPHSVVDHENALHARARRRRQSYVQSTERSVVITKVIATTHPLFTWPRVLSSRYLHHLIVGLLMFVAILASQMPLTAPFVVAPPVRPSSDITSDLVVPVAPIALNHTADGEEPVPDSAFEAIDALPTTRLRPDLLARQRITATVAADSANVRGGPGTDYDKLGELAAGTLLQVLAQANGWYQVREGNGRIVWITAELLALAGRAAQMVPDATTIPAPPPPRVGLVTEEGLNMRDGPGTAYVGMTKLKAGAQLNLLARYNDWLQVQLPEGQVGWVLSQYLTLAPGVMGRVEAVTDVPEANPALLGRTSERNVNLRDGPGVTYPQAGRIGAGVQLGLIGRYEDWFKIRTPDGATGWVSNELVRVNDFIARRVPVVRDIPALPRSKPASASQAASSPKATQPLPAPGASASSAVNFAIQFVGSRYVWGGASPKGFDCSGFTMYVYKQFGLDLPHSSAGQYSTKYGTMISNPADLQPGDIVFFINTYKRGISHVGIYIGGGDVVQAMSPSLGVGVASLNGGYWAEHYYGAIRPAR